MKSRELNIELPIYRFIIRKIDNGFTLSSYEELDNNTPNSTYRQHVEVFQDGITNNDTSNMDDKVKNDYLNNKTTEELEELCSSVRLLNKLIEKLDILPNKYYCDIKIKKR